MTEDGKSKTLDEAAKERSFAYWMKTRNFEAMFEWYRADLAKNIVDATICNLTDDSWSRGAMEMKFRKLKKDLAGSDTTPIVAVLAERVAVCYFDCYSADRLAQVETDLELARFFEGCRDRAHGRYLRAVKALADVRRVEAETIERTARKFKVVG